MPFLRCYLQVVHEFGEESKRKLLKFATGSDRAPIQGLGSSALVRHEMEGKVNKKRMGCRR